MKRVYLDNAATTKIRPEVAEVMSSVLSLNYGNPSSVHREGQAAKKCLEEARDSIAASFRCDPKEILFTSGGTESDNWAVKYGCRGGHIITSCIEHPAVLHSFQTMEKHGIKVTYLRVDKYGLISPKVLKDAISTDTTLVSVMMVNNEIGTIEPISELADIAHEHGVLFHTDAVQAAGQIPIDLSALPLDMLSFSAHKFHGPKGVGGLFVRKGTKLLPMLSGGHQEFGYRAGTENLPGIAGMAKALELACEEMDETSSRIRYLKELLCSELINSFPDIIFHGSPNHCHPGILNFYIPVTDGEKTLLLLDLKGFACSAGAACTSKADTVSHVISALGGSKDESGNSIRVSIGRENSEEEIKSFVSALCSILSA